jgi:DNA-binding PadR family transcriptional regulator
MQLLRAHGEMPLLKLHPTGPTTIAKMVEKGWVERVGSDTYRITAAGEAALKAELPEDYQRKSSRSS